MLQSCIKLSFNNRVLGMRAAAAAQEEEEDMSAAEEVACDAMAVGSLVITHLTPQDLRASEGMLPKQAVEANILPALNYSLLKFKVRRLTNASLSKQLALWACPVAPAFTCCLLKSKVRF